MKIKTRLQKQSAKQAAKVAAYRERNEEIKEFARESTLVDTNGGQLLNAKKKRKKHH